MIIHFTIIKGAASVSATPPVMMAVEVNETSTPPSMIAVQEIDHYSASHISSTPTVVQENQN